MGAILNMKCKKKKKNEVFVVLVLSVSVWWYSHKNRDLQTLYT